MTTKTCVFCGRGSQEIPLLTFEYRASSFNICPQHLPVLIHDPGQLAGRVEGAENFQPAAHKD
jgi:hypothetical protein